MKRKLNLLLCGLLLVTGISAQKQFKLSSPDGSLTTNIVVNKQVTYDISVDGRQIVKPSVIALETEDPKVWGNEVKAKGSVQRVINETIDSPFYRSTQMKNNCKVLTINLNNQFSVEFRAYNDGIAYRLISNVKKPFNIVKETVEYNFASDYTVTNPYVRAGRDGDFKSQFFNSFENLYSINKLSEMNAQRLSFLPLVVDAGNGVKVEITETHLENYPGLYLVSAGKSAQALKGVHAPVPKELKQGGHNELQMLVQTAEKYVAKVEKARTFPWRIAMVSRADKDLANNNLSYLLAAPSRLKDISWVKPGKVAWDWWNDWNIEGVDFRAGINNDTYKYYIDFASKHGIEYIILDEGWAVNKKADLFQVIPEIDLREIINYGKSKNVGIILWAGYWAFARDMEHVCKHFAEMGVKGFKVDFMDRDDQAMTKFFYDAAEIASRYHLMLDFHGAFKPSGLTRTYPNVINFEGVYGLENAKWGSRDRDHVIYDAQIPFIRQAAGPMDYTQGAMKNAVLRNFYGSNSEPMSMGTRCHQLALYIVLDSPINMLCDSPTNYMKEPDCTEFIAQIPTVWDQSCVMEGEIGKFIVTARQKGNTWYIGGITDWTARDINVDTSILPAGNYQMEIFQDGVNADRKGTDFKKIVKEFKAGSPLQIHLAPGGGFAIKFIKK